MLTCGVPVYVYKCTDVVEITISTVYLMVCFLIKTDGASIHATQPQVLQFLSTILWSIGFWAAPEQNFF